MPKTIDAPDTHSKSSDRKNASQDNSKTTSNGFQKTLSQNSRLIATLSHVASILLTATTILNPLWFLLLYLVVKDKFIKDNAREILNFELTLWAVLAVTGALTFVFFALIITIPLALITGLIFASAMIAQFVLPVIGALQANAGKVYRYPFSVRLFK